MRKTNAKKLSNIFIAFLVIALVFLAVGLGTLGSVHTAGDDFELKTKLSDNEDRPAVVLSLSTSLNAPWTDDEGVEHNSVNLRLVDILVNVSAIYAEPGTPARIFLRRSSSSTSFTSSPFASGTLQNGYTKEAAEGETAPAETGNALFNYVSPFSFTPVRLSSSNRYIEISVTPDKSEPCCNVRLSEIVFIGVDDNYTSNTRRYVIPATVLSATPDVGETAAQAKTRAEAVVDSAPNVQARMTKEDGTAVLPATPEYPQSSYYRFMDEESYSLLTLNEMRLGSMYTADGEENSLNTYNGDRVYNTLGTDILALGTLMFGMSPFGLRFMPMLASFGILVVGYFLMKALTKSEKAGLVFAVLYALCNLSFSLGHFGTPLTVGVFFFLAALLVCVRFYLNGIGHANALGMLPMLAGGLCAAASICVNGVFVIPVAVLLVLFALGCVKQRRAKQAELDGVIAEIEADEAASPDEERAPSEKRKKLSRILGDNRYRRIAAVAFPVALLLGTLVFSIVFLLPVYFPLIKLYDDPASPASNLFVLAWKAFAGGFTGVNAGVAGSVWNPFYLLFMGTGDVYAATIASVNLVGGLLALAAAVYGIVRLVKIVKDKGASDRAAKLRRVLIPLCGLVISLVCVSFGGGALGFLLLAYLFGFMLAADAARGLLEKEGKGGKAAVIVCASLVAVWFAIFAAFTFSAPLAAGLMTSIL